MWVAIATTCVTSTLFLTGLAPNLLAKELVKKTANVDLAWGAWFVAAAPAGLLLLVLVPLLTYWLYPPEVKEGAEVTEWAAQELANRWPALTPNQVLQSPFLLIGTIDQMTEAVRVSRAGFRGSESGSRIVGAFLEGPFLTPVPQQRGAHDPRWLRLPRDGGTGSRATSGLSASTEDELASRRFSNDGVWNARS
jgi:hypothetical protein